MTVSGTGWGGPVGRRTALTMAGAGAVSALAACSGSPVEARRANPEAVAPAAGATAGSGAGRVMIIRHAEKPAGSTKGVLPSGDSDSDSLVVQGWTRAGALDRLFAPSGGAPPATLATPSAIYAADPKSDASKRPDQTVSVLAAKLGIQVATDFTKSSIKDLVKAAIASAGSGAVLIAWQHQDIPSIVGEFPEVSPTPPSSWPDSRFDIVFVLDRSGSGWRFSQVPQLLLQGDSSDPIT